VRVALTKGREAVFYDDSPFACSKNNIETFIGSLASVYSRDFTAIYLYRHYFTLMVSLFGIGILLFIYFSFRRTDYDTSNRNINNRTPVYGFLMILLLLLLLIVKLFFSVKTVSFPESTNWGALQDLIIGTMGAHVASMHLPAYTYLIKVVFEFVGGDYQTTSTVMSIISALSTAVVLYLLTKAISLSHDRRLGSIILISIAMNPIVLVQSIRVEPYSLALMFSILSAYTFFAVLKGSPLKIVLAAFFNAVAFSLHPFSLFISIVIWISFFSKTKPLKNFEFRQYSQMMALVLILISPFMPFIQAAMSRVGCISSVDGMPSSDHTIHFVNATLGQIWGLPYSDSIVEMGLLLVFTIGILVYSLLKCISVARTSGRQLLFIVYFGTAGGILFVIFINLKWIILEQAMHLTTRHMVFFIPFFSSFIFITIRNLFSNNRLINSLNVIFISVTTLSTIWGLAHTDAPDLNRLNQIITSESGMACIPGFTPTAITQSVVSSLNPFEPKMKLCPALPISNVSFHDTLRSFFITDDSSRLNLFERWYDETGRKHRNGLFLIYCFDEHYLGVPTYDMSACKHRLDMMRGTLNTDGMKINLKNIEAFLYRFE